MKNFIPKFILENYTARNEHGYFDAYAMFVDLSGFTKLTETLMKQGSEGAERLSAILNHIFEPMVELVYKRGGFIPYFAGDAFTAVFPQDTSGISTPDFVITAEEQLELLQQARTNFPEFHVGIKIGLSAGLVEWGIIGKSFQTFYFRGAAIDGSAQSQTKAKENQIIADESLRKLLPESYPFLQLPNTSYYLLSGNVPGDSSQIASTTFVPLESPKELLEKFVSKSVIDFNQRGEFRTVIPIFISFEGVQDHVSLSDFVGIVLERINQFAGYFKEVDFGDKGGVLLGFFGAPVSYENNMERALEFVAAIQSDLEPFVEDERLKYRIGMTSGIAYSGIIGGKERSQYAAVGNRVNLAARLMIAADWGEVLVDSEIQKSRHFKFKHKEDTSYKGIEEVISTYKLIGKMAEQRHVFDGAMVGREGELIQLEDYASATFEKNSAQVAYIYGEAGIGKSRLSYEVRNYLQKRQKINWFTCQADQILQKPFNPFIYFLKNYFEQSPENTTKDNFDSFERRYLWLKQDAEKIDHPDAEIIQRELERTKPVLAALTGLKMPNSLWDNLDAKGRYRNTIAALTNLFITEALIQPIVIELEDGHWYDDNSKEFLEAFVWKIKEYPVLLLVTSRYEDDGTKPLVFKKESLESYEIPSLEIDLNILKPKALRLFAEERLKGKVSKSFYDLLLRTSNGNPFYVEQILEYFIESNLLEKENDEWYIKDNSIIVSTSINAVLTARIDRLSNLVKETVKAAAVIGREFEVPVLNEVMKVQEEFIRRNGNSTAVLDEQIKSAEDGQIWQATNELRYIFRHSLLREAVYDMQLRGRLRELHRLIAEAIERIYADQIEQRYVDLVFHYEQAEVEDKLAEYLKKAGEYAHQHFQNQQALTFYDKLLVILKKNKNRVGEADYLLKKGNILELIGQWDECQKIYDKALTLSRLTDDFLLIGRANNRLGYLLMLKGNYDDANMFLEAAAAFFESQQDNKGISKVYGNLGNLYFRQGKYEDAKSHFIRSIELGQMYKHTPANAQIVASLGLTYMNLGNYDEGIRWQKEQLEICEEVNDKQGMATIYTNMGIVYFEKGDYESALECYQKGYKLSEELGNKQLTSIAIGCIGSVYEKQGHYELAMEHFQKDLDLTKELGDKQGISIAYGLIGELYSILGKFDKAIKCMKQNLAISQDLGYKKGIAKAVNTLGDVYFYKNNYKTSLKYYNQAIDVTRSIGNKLVLGFSLVEKANVLLEMDKISEARAALNEAFDLAEELGNPDLIFEAKILSAKVAFKEEKPNEAKATLEMLLTQKPDRKEEAAVHFELNKITKDPLHRLQALKLYRVLFKETPHYVFRQRLKELE